MTRRLRSPSCTPERVVNVNKTVKIYQVSTRLGRFRPFERWPMSQGNHLAMHTGCFCESHWEGKRHGGRADTGGFYEPHAESKQHGGGASFTSLVDR